MKAQNIGGHLGAFLVRKFVSQRKKKAFRANIRSADVPHKNAML